MSTQTFRRLLLPLLFLLLLSVLIPCLFWHSAVQQNSGQLVCKRRKNSTTSQEDSLRKILLELERNWFLVAEPGEADSMVEDTCDVNTITQMDNIICPVIATVEARPMELPAAQVHLTCLCSQARATMFSIHGSCNQVTKSISVMRLQSDSNAQHMCPEGTDAYYGNWMRIKVNKSCSFSGASVT